MEDLTAALGDVRALLLDPHRLVRAVGAGRRRSGQPRWRRVEVRPVDLKSGRVLQVVAYDDRQAITHNHGYDAAGGAAAAVDQLLAEPFGNWHVQTTDATVQLRVTKKGDAQLHRRAEGAEQHTTHDRAAAHLIDPGDPLFTVLGAGARKRRQVDAFLRMLAPAVDEAGLPSERPLRVVDLGSGNAYLSFAAYRFLAQDREVRLVGVDQRTEMCARNNDLASELGWGEAMEFRTGSILDADVDPPVDVVLALHACDTATDDALARAVRWRAPVVLASPCCHHHLQAQLSATSAPAPYGVVARHAILRERLGDVLTDALRAALLRRLGYRVDVLQFVASEHTPRDTMIRAVRAEAADGPDGEYDDLVATWGVTPYLQTLLADDLAAAR